MRSAVRSALRSGAAAAAMAAMALSGCAGSSVTRFHSLQPVLAASGSASASTSRYDGPPLQLRSVAVPVALDRAQLLREVGPGQFEVRDLDHWAAPLPDLARKALSEDLALRLPPGKLAFAGASWPASGADLRVDIQSFEIRAGMATMQLSWSLRPRAAVPSARPLAVQGAQLQLQVPAGDGASATAEAFSALLARLADRIVEVLDKPVAATGS